MSLIDHGRNAVRAADAETARHTRLDVYSSWIADDVDGVIHNLKPPLGEQHPNARAVLAVARSRVARALEKIDAAYAAAVTPPK